MATLRTLAISLHRLAGATNIAATLRHHAHNATRPLQPLKISDFADPLGSCRVAWPGVAGFSCSGRRGR